MSNAFEDREKAFEAKYRLDQETEFKAHVRRNKLLGLWAAEQMGLSADDAQAYAKTLVELELTPGHHDLEQRLLADLAKGKADVSPEKVQHQIARLTALAHDQIVAEQASKAD
jgi:hypothetical protein